MKVNRPTILVEEEHFDFVDSYVGTKRRMKKTILDSKKWINIDEEQKILQKYRSALMELRSFGGED